MLDSGAVRRHFAPAVCAVRQRQTPHGTRPGTCTSISPGEPASRRACHAAQRRTGGLLGSVCVAAPGTRLRDSRQPVGYAHGRHARESSGRAARGCATRGLYVAAGTSTRKHSRRCSAVGKRLTCVRARARALPVPVPPERRDVRVLRLLALRHRSPFSAVRRGLCSSQLRHGGAVCRNHGRNIMRTLHDPALTRTDRNSTLRS